MAAEGRTAPISHRQAPGDPARSQFRHAGLVPPLSGSHFDTARKSLGPVALSPLSSPPGLSRGSMFSFAAKEHVDARDKPAHDNRSGGSEREPRLLHRNALREVAGLVDVGAFEDGDVVGEELDGHG